MGNDPVRLLLIQACQAATMLCCAGAIAAGGATAAPADRGLDSGRSVDYSAGAICQPRSIVRFAGGSCAGVSSVGLAPVEISRALPDGLARYDLHIEPGDDAASAAGLLALQSHIAAGRLNATLLGRRSSEAHEVVRLETAWPPPWPAAAGALRIGDGITRSGAWGRAVRFGGLQWGTAPAPARDALATPWVASADEAVVPSAFDLFIDEAAQRSHAVASAPFDVLDAAASASGTELSPVTYDLLGRRRPAASPNFAAAGPLPAGRSNTHLEAGRVREAFGTASNRYGRRFVTASRSMGISDRLGGELRAELLARRRTLGAAANWRWPVLGTASLAGAASHGKPGSGRMVSFGVERQSGPLDYGLRTRWLSPRFTQLGMSESQPAPRRSSLARVRLAPAGGGALALNYAVNQDSLHARVQLLSLRYTLDHSRERRISFVALKSLADSASAFHFGVMVSQSLGG